MYGNVHTTRPSAASMVAASAGLSAPMPISDVQSQVLRLEESTHHLEGTVATLIGRLESVLTPDRIASADGHGETAARGADTALSQQLYSSCNRIENLQARVSEVIARLGI